MLPPAPLKETLHTLGVLQETKTQLTSTAKKLKEAKEEGEQIRSDLKRMITQYQVRRTSLALTQFNSSSYPLYVCTCRSQRRCVPILWMLS